MQGMGEIPGMPAPGEKMTQAQKDQLLAQMPPELREQAKAISAAMADIGAICKAVLPPPDKPDRPLPAHQLVMALASAPSFHALGEHLVPETLDALEAALIAHGAFSEGALVLPEGPALVEPNAPKAGLEPASAVTPTELYAHWEDTTGKRSDAAIRRNALLIYWIMYKHKFGEDEIKLDPRTNIQTGLVNTIATKLLIRCQTVMPLQNKWVQPSITVANLSARFCNQLWSDEHPDCLKRMGEILEETGSRFPSISIEARCSAAETGAATILPGKQVAIDINMIRSHAHEQGAELPECTNPQGIYEAYWCYVEGLKPEGTPNTLVSAQPVVVKDLTASLVEAKFIFIAPETPGEYGLRLHFCNTSIIGCYETYDCRFEVAEDDVPCLE
mmetsp:Transcript_75892/g.201635  ORF Transcript_75892/g.201635 Transcript_75892/m.201635 type:complete len:388 (+) Transcript_75892:32-1195(+)